MRLLLRRATRAMSQQPVWIMIALVLDAAIAVAVIAVGPSFNLTGLLAVGPLLACARCNGRMTALVAGYALALCAIVAALTGTIRTAMEGYRIGMVAVAGALAVLAAVIRSRREGALIKISERVQHAILRPLPAELGGVAFASHYQSASAAALVGGDLYDITMTQFGPRFIIGDVKGKGLDAVGRCAAVLADFAAGEVRIVNCGHHPPAKLEAAACGLQIMTPDGFSPPLGLHPRPVRQDIALKPGDRLLFYTDGLVETRDRAGRFFDLGDRVAAALALPDLAPPDLTLPDLALPHLDGAVKRVARRLIEHAGGELTDDVLLVLCQPVADPPALITPA